MYKMNTNETKGKIWNMCIEKGIFNKIKGDDFKKIQEIFEKIIKGYEQVEPNQDIFNKVIDSISFEIYNQTQNQSQGQNQNNLLSISESRSISGTTSGTTSASFEAIQKEYDALLNSPPPKQIDFTNTIIKNQALNENNYEPQIQIQNTYTNVDEPFTNTTPNTSTNISIETNQINQIKLEDIIMTQNKILIQILETQVKILSYFK